MQEQTIIKPHLLQLGKHVEVVFTSFPPDHTIQRRPTMSAIPRRQGVPMRLVQERR